MIKITDSLKKRKYFARIFFWITMAVLALVLVFSSITYYNAEKVVLNSENSNSKKLLYQMEYNMNNTVEMVKSLCLSVFFNSDVKDLMYSSGEDATEQFSTIEKLRASYVSPNQFIHSINVYNNRKKILYSTYYSMYNEDNGLEKLIGSKQKIPVLKPVLREIEVNQPSDVEKYVRVASFFLYDTTDKNNVMDGGVILNVNLDWLFNNLNLINMVDPAKEEKIYILDDKGNPIDGNEADPTEREASSAYLAGLKAAPVDQNADVGIAERQIKGEKYLISGIPVPSLGWTILKIEPYNQIYQYANRLKEIIVVITVIFIILVLVVSLCISFGIYKPIGQLVKQTASIKPKLGVEMGKSSDEILYLREFINKSFEQLDKSRKELRSNGEIIKRYFLSRLLVDSASVANEGLPPLNASYKISIAPDKNMILCVFRIDKYKDFVANLDAGDRNVFKFALQNIIGDVFSSEFANETVDMENDQTVLILNAETGGSELQDRLIELIRKSQEYIQQYLGFTVSAAVSEVARSIKDITPAYNNALSNSMYRLIYGRMSIITPEMAGSNAVESSFEYRFDNEDKFVEDLRNGNLDGAEEKLARFIEKVRTMDYNSVILSMMYLINTIKNTVFEINRKRSEPINLGPLLYNREILEIETIDDFLQRVKSILVQISDSKKAIENDKHKMLSDAIRDVIYTNYSDNSLCLAKIAEIFTLSPSYVSMIFKENFNISIPEYLSDVRMQKAVEWMENSKFSINEVMLKVGIENESYFYKLFKKKYGTTPRDYMVESHLRKLTGKRTVN